MHTRLLPSALAAFFLLAATACAGLLDRTVWEVELVPTRQTSAKGAKIMEDVLTFSRGQLTSEALQRAGIGAVDYSASGAKGFFNWKTTPILKTKDTAEWAGVINGRNIDGNFKWINAKGRVLYYTIKGHKR